MKSFIVQGSDMVEVEQPIVTMPRSRLTIRPSVAENVHRYGRTVTGKYGQNTFYDHALLEAAEMDSLEDHALDSTDRRCDRRGVR